MEFDSYWKIHNVSICKFSPPLAVASNVSEFHAIHVYMKETVLKCSKELYVDHVCLLATKCLSCLKCFLSSHLRWQCESQCASCVSVCVCLVSKNSGCSVEFVAMSGKLLSATMLVHTLNHRVLSLEIAMSSPSLTILKLKYCFRMNVVHVKEHLLFEILIKHWKLKKCSKSLDADCYWYRVKASIAASCIWMIGIGTRTKQSYIFSFYKETFRKIIACPLCMENKLCDCNCFRC